MLKFISIFAFVAVASSCSHAPTAKSETDANSQNWSDTAIDIHYVLRHSDRRLTLEAGTQGIHGKSLVDGTQLKQCQIDASRYQEFLTKVRNFMTQRRSIASTPTPGNSTDCRAPYTIVLKNQKDTLQIQGCRTQDEGAFSHLVQDGEFLIYRQK